MVATLDTKEQEATYLCKAIKENGAEVMLMDVGILTPPRNIKPNITREEVAFAAGTSIDELLKSGNKGKCIEAMILGARRLARKLYDQGEFVGVIGIGGAQGTNIATSVMRELPFGVPKFMVSTIACGKTTFGPFVGTKDVVMMHSVADMQGLNVLTIRVLRVAAAAICGMVREFVSGTSQERKQKVVAMSMLGTTTVGALRAKKLLEEKNFQVVAFHQNGTGGIAMEELIQEGLFDGVMDINLHELADWVVGGLHAAIKDFRLESASKMGLPQVIAPGSIDYSVRGPLDSLPLDLKKRQHVVHNPTLTLVRLSIDEMIAVAKLLADKINRISSPVKVFLPLRGFSYHNREGLELWDPEGNTAFIETLKNNLNKSIPLEEIDAHINDSEFIDVVVSNFVDMLEKAE
ncbi:Tm-1-like ATP-binding domain-containing protein [Atrimonas thermophila]|uniref:Tm-1-like ATP-binding domain-containing protein n=1 Tax=Atrimonas thermophila TaxID=3064161 RepID=UPI00399CCEA3